MTNSESDIAFKDMPIWIESYWNINRVIINCESWYDASMFTYTKKNTFPRSEPWPLVLPCFQHDDSPLIITLFFVTYKRMITCHVFPIRKKPFSRDRYYEGYYT